jgi:hypothetical protein
MNDVVQIDEEFLSLDPDTDGLHRRLMAGLDSLAGRAGCPQIESVRRGRSARDAGKGYSDYDIVVRITPGHSGYRQVTGWIEVPLHMTCGGNVTRHPLYEPVRFDLIVGSSATHEEYEHEVERPAVISRVNYVPNEMTRFVGEFMTGAPSVAVREAAAARGEAEDGFLGPTSMFDILRNSPYSLLSRAADAALVYQMPGASD